MKRQSLLLLTLVLTAPLASAQVDSPVIDVPIDLPDCSVGLACAEMDVTLQAVNSFELVVPTLDLGAIEVGATGSLGRFGFMQDFGPVVEVTAPDDINYLLSFDGGQNVGNVDGASDPQRRLSNGQGAFIPYELGSSATDIVNGRATYGTLPNAVGVEPFTSSAQPTSGRGSFDFGIAVGHGGAQQAGTYSDTVTVFIDLVD